MSQGDKSVELSGVVLLSFCFG